MAIVHKKVLVFISAALSANTGLIAGVTLATSWPASQPDLRAAWVAAWVVGGQWAWLLLYASHKTRKRVQHLLYESRQTWLPTISDRAAEELYRLLLRDWDALLEQSADQVALSREFLHVFRNESEKIVQQALSQLDAADSDWKAWIPPAALRWVPKTDTVRTTLASLEEMTGTLSDWIQALILEYEASRSIQESELSAWLQQRTLEEVERLAGARLTRAETLSQRIYAVWMLALAGILLAPWPAWIFLQYLLNWISA